MQTLLFLGNGFDIAHGARTRYADFYEEYKNVKPVNELEKKMIEEITGDRNETWADLELALGKFTSESKDAGEFQDLYFHLAEELSSYLKKVNNKISATQNDDVLRDFFNPAAYLTPAEKSSLVSSLRNFKLGDIDFNIISFNYTNILERLLGYQDQDIMSASFLHSSNHCFLRNIWKIHGRLSQTPLLGVNDESQIANRDFAKNQDVVDFLVKPQSNKVLGSLVDERCLAEIRQCNLFLIHGVSLGSTDKMWWSALGERLMSSVDSYVIYFYYDGTDSIDGIHATLMGQQKRKVKDRFLKACGISEDKIDKVSSRIFVSINSGFMV